jgi:hypothetical protein
LLREFFRGGSQITIFVEVADNALGDFLHGVGTNGDAQLPGKVVGEAGGRRQKFLERGPLGNFPFLRLPAVAAGVQILIEEAADVELVKGIGFRLLGNFFSFGLQKSLVAIVVGLRRLFALLFQDGIGDHLLVDHLAQLQAIEREHADHLHQTWRQNLPLRHLQIQF